MKTIRLLDEVETSFPDTTKDEPVRVVADASGKIECHGTVWKLPAGAEIAVGDTDADRLVGLGLAEEVAAETAPAKA